MTNTPYQTRLTFRPYQTVLSIKLNSHNVKHYPRSHLWKLFNTRARAQPSLGVPPILSTRQRLPSDPSYIQLNPDNVAYNQFTHIWTHLNTHSPANILIVSSIQSTKQQHLTFKPKQRILVPSNHSWTYLNTPSYVVCTSTHSSLITWPIYSETTLALETRRVLVPSSWVPKTPHINKETSP